ncbi:hypothetical protein ACWDBF_16690 [Streptomyces angustmyceticus]
MAEKHLLILLDNCEHRVEPVAAFAGAWLVTSRCPEGTCWSPARKPSKSPAP